MTTTLRRPLRTARRSTRPRSRIGTRTAAVESVAVTAAARPVQEILLELAFRLHATRVVGRRPAPAASPAPADAALVRG